MSFAKKSAPTLTSRGMSSELCCGKPAIGCRWTLRLTSDLNCRFSCGALIMIGCAPLLPSKLRSLDEFLDGIEAELAMNRPVNLRDATRAVFQILSRHVNRGQIEKVRQALPEDVRAIWHDDPNAPDVRKRPQRYARAANRRTDPRPKRSKPTTKPENRASRGKHGENRGSQISGWCQEGWRHWYE
jgi:hypothetical protein